MNLMLHIMKSSFKSLFSKKFLVLLILTFPLALVAMFGFLNNNVKKSAEAQRERVQEQVNVAFATEIKENADEIKLALEPHFSGITQASARDELVLMVEDGRISCGVYFRNDAQKSIEIIYDANTKNSTNLKMRIAQTISSVLPSFLPEVNLNAEADNWFSDNVMVSLMFGVFCMAFIIIALNGLKPIVHEREIFAYGRMMTTPLKSWQYLLGHMLAAFIILTVQSAIVAVLITLFKLNSGVSLLQFVAICIPLSFFALCGGILLVSVCKTSSVYQNLYMCLITPIAILSGGFVPLQVLPPAVSTAMNLSPLTWIVRAFNIMVSGGPSENILTAIGVSAALSIVLLVTGIMIESRKTEIMSVITDDTTYC